MARSHGRQRRFARTPSHSSHRHARSPDTVSTPSRPQGLPAWAVDTLALCAGAVGVLAFAPFGVGPLGVAALAVLFAVWARSSPPRACWRGWLFGVGLFGGGVYWVYFSMHVHGHLPVAVAAVFTGIFALLLALFPAMAGYTAARLRRSGGPAVWLVLVVPGVWILLEWVRSWFLSGFPWLNVGYTQVTAPLAGFASLLGVYGVGWATAVSAALAVWGLGRATGARARALALALLVGLWGIGWALGELQWTRPAGATLSVSLIQGNVAQARKWDPGYRRRILERYNRLLERAWGSDVVVLPETAIPAFLDQAGRYLDALERQARAQGTDLLLGLPVRDPPSGRYYNAMVRLGDGPRGRYLKRHLVPFGEYIPFENLLGRVLDILQVPMADFSPGPAAQPPVPTAGHSAGISICYEIAFGGLVNDVVPPAAYLVSVSNNSWFGDSSAPHQVLEMARMRALELERAVVSATNDGVTAIIDHRGRVTDALPQFQEGVLTGWVQPRRGATPYARLGDAPIVVALFAVLGLTAVWLRRD